MNLYCVSDLHCTDRGPRDNFAVGDRGDRFYRFLDYVAADNGKLLILGDLFDWWQGNLAKCVLAYRQLLENLAGLGAIWVYGNHDNALTAFLGTGIRLQGIQLPTVTKAFEKTIGGRRFAFLHGHESDPYCRDANPGTGEITAIISALLEDKNKAPFRNGHAVEDQFIGTLEGALTLWRRLTFQHGRLDEMIDGVEAYRKEAGADVVVYGHTHEAGNIGDFHYNTGTWARRCDTFAQIDDEGKVRLFEWLGSVAVPFENPLR